MWSSLRIYFRPTSIPFIYKWHATSSQMWITFIRRDTCLIFQHSDINEIEIQLNKNFSSIYDWFVDNKLSIHFGEDKTKSILFSSKSKIKKASPLNIQYKGKKVKQYSKVTYLGCIFDETLPVCLPACLPVSLSRSLENLWLLML